MYDAEHWKIDQSQRKCSKKIQENSKKIYHIRIFQLTSINYQDSYEKSFEPESW